MSWKDRSDDKVQLIINLIKENFPQLLVEKKSGMKKSTYAKYFKMVSDEHLDVIKRWNPRFEMQLLEEFPKKVQELLLKSRKDTGTDCFVRIDRNDDDGSLRLSLYEMEIKNKALGKNSDENQDHNSGGETVSPSATQLTQELA